MRDSEKQSLLSPGASAGEGGGERVGEGGRERGGEGGGTGAREEVPFTRPYKCRRPKAVEPLAVLYSFTVYGFVSLNSEYVYKRVLSGTNSTLHYWTGYSSYYYYSPYATPVIGRNTNYTTDSYGGPDGGYDRWKITLDVLQGYISSSASTWVMYLSFAGGIPPVFTILLILSLTDRYGRKVGLVLPCVGALVRYICYLIVEWHQLPLSCLVIGNFIEGLCGGSLTFLGAGLAYIADTGDIYSRSFRFTLFNSIMVMSSAMSNLAVGYMIATVGWLKTFVIFTCLVSITLHYAIFLIPETRHVMTSPDHPSCTTTLQDTMETFKVFHKEREDPKGKYILGGAFLGVALFHVVASSCVDLDSVYLLGEPFYYDAVRIGHFLYWLAFLGVVCSVSYVRVMQHCGVSDLLVMVMAAMSGAAAFLVQSFARDSNTLYSVTLLHGIAPAVVPVGRSLMSKYVTENEQGALQATISSMSAVCKLLSSALLGAIYSATVEQFPGTVFIIMSIILLMAAGVFTVTYFTGECRQPEEQFDEMQTLRNSENTQGDLEESSKHIGD